MMIKKKQLSNKQPYTKFTEEKFHYKKKTYYVKDCHLKPKQKLKDKKTTKKAK